jgi:hypothetical protein
VTIDSDGDVGIGDTTPDATVDVVGDVLITSKLESLGGITSHDAGGFAVQGVSYYTNYDGSNGDSTIYFYQTSAISEYIRWDYLNTYFYFTDAITAGGCTGCDIAESFTGDPEEGLTAGDVLIIDSEQNEWYLRKSDAPYDSRVAGIYTTTPGIYMSEEMNIGGNYNFSDYGEFYHNGTLPIALAGRVPVKVTAENGPIKKGDLVTTSSTPGKAMRWSLVDIDGTEEFDDFTDAIAENENRKLAVLGKALEDAQDDPDVIDVIITV